MSEHFQECGDSQWEKRVTEGFVQSRCLRTHDYKTGYILAGDSHAEHLLIGLTASSPGASFAYATRVGLPLLSNLGFFQFFEAVAQDQSIRGVILSAHWASKLQSMTPSNFSRDLNDTLTYLAQHVKEVYLFDDVPIFPFNAQRCAYADRLWLGHRCDAPIDEVTRNPIDLGAIVASVNIRSAYSLYRP